MWSCLFVGFVEKDDISPYDGFESVEERNRGEDPSRVFYFPRLQGYRSSSATVKEDETTRLSLLFGVKRLARPSRIPASLSPLCFQGHPLPSLSKRWLSATENTSYRSRGKREEEGLIVQLDR